MYVCVCVCVCMYVCVISRYLTYIHTYMYLCICLSVCMCVYVCRQAGTKWMHACNLMKNSTHPFGKSKFQIEVTFKMNIYFILSVFSLKASHMISNLMENMFWVLCPDCGNATSHGNWFLIPLDSHGQADECERFESCRVCNII